MEKILLFGILLIASLSWIHPVTGERILFFLPLSSNSMANIFEPLGKALSDRGHELTVIAPIKFKINSKNVTQIQWYTAAELFKDYPDPFELRRSSNLFRLPLPFQQKYCHEIFQKEELHKIMDKKYDLLIVNIFFQDCFAGVFHKMGTPIIHVATIPLPSAMLELHGSHLPSSFIPLPMLSDISEQMSFKQRTKNFLYNAYFSFMMEIQTRPHLEEIYRQYLGQDIPTIREIYRNQVSLILQNSHYGLTNPRPLLPSVVEIGGIHCKDPKPLPKDLEDFVSGAKHGVIVFSLGSIVRASSMPEAVRLAFLKTFANLKQRVVWKWELEGGMPDAPENVKIVKWLPQQDLLGHSNVRLFITHGGLLSTEEAVYHGVPVLGFPIFADQDVNMRQAEILGFGIKGEILDLTKDQLEPQVRQLLDEPRYAKRAKNLSRIFRDRPHSSVDTGVFWTEYILRHKGAYHLRSAGMHLNVFQYHSIDVVAFLLTVIIFSVLFVYFLIKLLVSPAKTRVDAGRKKGNTVSSGKKES